MILYHITSKYLGKKVILNPNNSEVEDDSCICVGPSIEQCLLALPERHFDLNKRLYVYYTTSSGSKPAREFDCIVTQERRFYKPVEFSFLGKLDKDVSEMCKFWVHNDKYGVEANYLTSKERKSIFRIKLNAIKRFCKKKRI